MADDFTTTALQTSQAREEAAFHRWLGSSHMPASAAQTPDTLRALLHERAAVHGIDPLLAEALVSVESGMNPRARSPRGAMGLMQLMPGTVARFQVQDPWDPQQNIDGGMQYLKFLKEMFPGRLDLQLAGYNAGDGAVKKYGNTIPPYEETKKYVPAVLAKYEALRGSPYLSKRTGTGAPGDMAPVVAPPGTTMQDEAAYRAWLGSRIQRPDEGSTRLAVTFPPQVTPQGPLGAEFTSVDRGAPGYPARVAASAQALPSRMAPGMTPILPASGMREPGLETDLLGRREPTQILGDLGQQIRTGIMSLYHGPTSDIPTEPPPSSAPREITPSPERPGTEGGPPLAATWTPEPPLQTTFAPVDQNAPGYPTGVAASAQALPPRVAPDLTPYVPFKKLEPALVENRVGRIVGSIAQGTLQLYHGLLSSLVAGEHLVGLPNIPAAERQSGIDPMGVALLDPVFTQLEKAVEPRVGERGPDFVDRLFNAVGTSLGSILPAASVGRFLEGMAAVAPRVARGGAALTGGVLEGAGEAGDLYKNLVPLVGEDEAAKRALKSFAANVVLVTATDKYGIFGERASFLRKTMNGVFTNTLQEGLQYDIERRGFVVPADHPQADTLKLQGWEQRGTVLFKPFVLKDAAEVMAIGALIGGAASAGVALAAEQQVPAVRDLVEQDQTTIAPQIPETLVKGADGLPLRVYHGTSAVFKTFELAKADPHGLYGPGLYFTDAPGVAGGTGADTAQLGYSVLPLGNTDVLDLRRAERDLAIYRAGGDGATSLFLSQQHIQPGVTLKRDSTQVTAADIAARTQALETEIGAIAARLTVAPNIHPAYLDITQPFVISDTPLEPGLAMTLAQGMRLLGIEARGYEDGVLYVPEGMQRIELSKATPQDLYSWLADSFGKLQANAILAASGYDGIVHTGGALTGGKPHQVYIAFSPSQVHPAFGIEAALQAAQSPETPPPGVDQPTWKRWAQAVLDLLPEASFGPTPGGLLSSERGSTGAPGQGVGPGGIPRTPALIQADIDALDAGGASADEVAQRLGVDSPQAAYRVLFPEMADAQAAEAAQQPAVQQASPELPGTPPVPVEPSPRGPTLRAGAEVLTPEQYRTPSGGWRIPLGDIPPQELELQDFIRQPDEQGRRGIKLSGEELQGELAGLISLKETQARGLQNNRSGLTLQQMAERAQQMGFIRTADKEALLEAMDRSITQGHRVYSAYATGTIPLLHDPFVRAAYQHTLDAIDTLEGRTEEQRRGTRPHAQAIAEGQALVDSGLLNMEDVRALLPGTTLDDASLAAVILRLRDVTTAMEQAAQRFADTGYRVGSPEEDAVLSIMGMFAEVHPKLQGVVAEQGRGLSLLNNPMSAYTGFYNDLRQLLLRAPGLSTRSLADKILATATPEARLVQTPQEISRSIVERFQDQVSILHDRVLRALDNLNQPERHASALRQGMEDLETRFRALQSERTQEPFRSHASEFAPQVEQLATDVQRALDTPGDAAILERVRRRLEALLEQMPRTLPLTPEAEQARLDALHADLAAFPSTRTQLEAQLNAPLSESGLPFPLELTPETTPQVPHTPEEQARIDAAYQTAATARTPAEWRVIDRERRALSRQQAEARWWQTHGEILARERARIEEAGPLVGPLAPKPYPWEPPALQPELPLAVPRVLSPAAQASIEASRPGFAAMFREQHTAAMLGPRSWIRNTIGMGYTTVIALPVRLMASLPGMFHEGGVTPSETAAMLWGEAHGVHEMWSALAHAWATGESMTEQMAGQSSTPGGKTDVFPKATTAANLRALGVPIDPNSMAGKFFDFWAEWIGFSGWGRQSHRIMNSVDEFGLMANFLGQRNVLAYREAMAQGQMDVRAWSDNYARVVTDPAIAARISQEAFQFAEVQMLHNALQPGRLGHWIGQLSDITVPIPGTQQEFPIGVILMPFKKIPLNAAKFAVEQSPLGLALRDVRAQIAKGGPAADVAISKMLVGTSIMGAAALLVAKGLLTGRAPEDKIQREVWMRGRQEYSARLPNGLWLDYRVDPLGQDLSMLTDFVQIMGNAHVAPEVFDRLPTALFVTLNKDLWSATAARTIADFFGAVMPNPGTGGELVTQRFMDWAQRTGLSAIPVLDSASLRAWQRYDDPVKHETKTLLDKLYAMIPVWSRDVPAKRTLGGEKQLYGYGVGPESLRPFLRALNPLAMMEEHLSPADKAIEKYQMQLSYAPKNLAGHALPAGQEVSAQVDMAVLQALQLTPRQYERFEVLSAGNQQEAHALGLQLPDKALELPTRSVGQLMGVTPPKKAMGLTEILDWLVTVQRWKDEEDAKQQVGQARDPYFEKYFAQIVHTYRQTGLQLLLAQDPDLRKQYYNAVMERGIMALPPSKREEMLQRLSGKVPLDAQQIRKQLGIASPPAETPSRPLSDRDILERIGVGR